MGDDILYLDYHGRDLLPEVAASAAAGYVFVMLFLFYCPRTGWLGEIAARLEPLAVAAGAPVAIAMIASLVEPLPDLAWPLIGAGVAMAPLAVQILGDLVEPLTLDGVVDLPPGRPALRAAAAKQTPLTATGESLR